MIPKPMLACKHDPNIPLNYPVLGSPKLDGIRARIVEGVVMSRAMKPIPNNAIQQLFGHAHYNGLDGELIEGNETAPTIMQATVSVVMSHDKPATGITFRVFDDYTHDGPFHARIFSATQRANACRQMNPVQHLQFDNDADLMAYEAQCVAEGYEGIMIRDPNGPYKSGRSTLKEGYLLKVKRFEDAEAVVTGTVEEMHNTNEAVTNELGRTSRSTAQAGKVGKNRLGALQVHLASDPSVTFEIGSGYDAIQRADFWRDRDQLLGRTVTFRHQPSGAKDKPRFPVFHGFRSPLDISA